MFIGLDVSKFFHVASTVDGKSSLTFNHDATGFLELKIWVQKLADGAIPTFGLEPTGQYSFLIAAWIREQGWHVKMVPGVYTKRAKYFLTNSGLKTDLVDAKVIAELTAQGRCKNFYDRKEAFVEMRELSDYFLRLSKTKVAAYNRLHALVDSVFPELSRLMNIKTKSCLQLLKVYSTPRDILEAGFEEIHRFLYKNSYGQLSKERMYEIYIAASQTVGRGSLTHTIEIRHEVELLEQTALYRNQVEISMQEWLNTIEYGPNLQTIPGLQGPCCAIILGQLGDLTDYRNKQQLYKAAGINLIEYSSGQLLGRQHISRMGSSTLRRYLFIAAVQAYTRKTSAFNHWFKEKTETKPKKVVLVAGMRKLLRIAHAIAHSNQPFEASRVYPILLDAVGKRASPL